MYFLITAFNRILNPLCGIRILNSSMSSGNAAPSMQFSVSKNIDPLRLLYVIYSYQQNNPRAFQADLPAVVTL